jgi:hypothetical protein
MRAASALAALLIAMPTSSKRPTRPPSPGGDTMTAEQLRTRLDQARPDDSTRLKKAAQDVAAAANVLPRELAALWHSKDPDTAYKAQIVLSRLEELAIRPLLDSPPARAPADRAWLAVTVAEAAIELRGRLVGALERMLEDRAVIPRPANAGPVEEPLPDRRVCDEAYLQLRRVLKSTESVEAYYLNANAFLRLSVEEKETEIQKARGKHAFSELSGMIDE